MTRHGLGLASLLLLILVPLAGNAYIEDIGIFVFLQSVAVIGLGFLTGFAGRISLAQGALIGVGAYTAALFATTLHLPPLAGLLPAILAATLVALVLVGPAIRLSGLYFVMSTIGLQEIVWIVLMNWSDLTHGPQGVRDIPAFSIAGYAFASPGRYYYVALAAAAVSYLLARRVIASRFGVFLRALADDELAAATSGVAVVPTKLLALALSAGWAGLAGFLQTYYIRFVHPDMFTLDFSVVLLTMACFGGRRSLEGMLVATAILGSASEYLRPFGEFRLVAYGALLLLAMMFFPRGIAAIIPDTWRGRLAVPGPRT